MTQPRRLVAGPAVFVVAAVLALFAGPAADALRADLPARLSDQDFWALSLELSEPGGSFQSDNLVSNETGFQGVIPELTSRLGEGGVYLGVGPEQNFTYIAALKPRIVFILDIRRGNRDLHLMYKALFELAADRAEFVSLLFSRPKPAFLTKDASAREIFAAFGAVAPSEEDYQRNLARIWEVLVKKHGIPLSSEELEGIKFVYANFHEFGPGITYSSNRNGRNGTGVTYASLMGRTNTDGIERSYLANEENFNVLKRLEAANLLVPVVGNFSGPKALRAVGTWLRDRNVKVSAYYLSNVEEYLSRDGSWLNFCGNASTLPLDDKSTFIRSGTGYRAPASPGQRGAASPVQSTSTVTLPDGRVFTVMSAGATSAGGVTSVGGLTTNRTGLMRDDLAPCAPPKLPLSFSR
jgi:hypothetical protein